MTESVFDKAYVPKLEVIRRLVQERREAYTSYRDGLHALTGAMRLGDHHHERMYWADRKLRTAHLDALKCLARLVPDPDMFWRHLGVAFQPHTTNPFCFDGAPSFDPCGQ